MQEKALIVVVHVLQLQLRDRLRGGLSFGEPHATSAPALKLL